VGGKEVELINVTYLDQAFFKVFNVTFFFFFEDLKGGGEDCPWHAKVPQKILTP
jgi:hypothetical protein